MQFKQHEKGGRGSCSRFCCGLVHILNSKKTKKKKKSCSDCVCSYDVVLCQRCLICVFLCVVSAFLLLCGSLYVCVVFRALCDVFLF